MEGNPFEGTKFEQDWVNGFQAGLVAPNDNITAPSPLVLEAQDAFNQGVSAGQLVNSALDPPLEVDGGFEEAADGVHVGIDLLGPVVSLFGKASKSGGSFFTAFRAGALAAGTEIVFNLMVLIAIWGPRRDTFFSDAVSARLEAIRRQIADHGIADNNLELFMAVCADERHETEIPDPMTELGVWHGPFRLDFGAAAQDASQHEHAGVKIHRYQTAQPTLVDILDVQ